MAELGIRKWLKDNGYAKNDDEITYGDGTVYLKGRKFMDATPQTDGKTYGEESDLAKAFGNYTQNEYTNKYNSLLDNVSNRMNQQPKVFDKNTDQIYQSQLAAAKANAEKDSKKAQNNAYALMRSRGQGKSSWSDTVGNQIQQNAYANVALNLEPQYMKESYQRFLDEQNAERSKTNDLLGLANTYNNLYQQGFNNDVTEAGLTGKWNGENTLPQRIANANEASRLGQETGRVLKPTDDWGSPLLDQVQTAPLNMAGQQFQSGEQQRGIENARADRGEARADRQLEGTLSNIYTDNSLRADSNALAWEKFDFERQQANAPKSQSAEDYVKYIDSTPGIATKDEYGNVSVNKDAVERIILSSGLPEGEMAKLYQRYGLKMGN